MLMDKIAAKFQVEQLQPYGIKITANQDADITDLNGLDLKSLAEKHQIVLLRGFNFLEKANLVHYAKSMGALLEWGFGQVMEMQVQEMPKNYLFTNGPVPFHWDGAFHQVPSFLLFHCIQAPLPESGGETIFCNTQLLWQQANAAERRQWQTYSLNYKTEKLAHYGGAIQVPLVQQHPVTHETILRFAEPVPATLLNPVEASVEQLAPVESADFFNSLAERCYQPHYCYSHTWQENDFLIADNHALIHGRNAFKAFSPRHLRRIQVL